jgi:para-aminobenzoate synthetase/4-amino-4-deoxychorismate lyase
MASAAHFGGEVRRSQVEAELAAVGARLVRPSRVRLLVDLDGRVEIETRGQILNCESRFTIQDLTPVPVAVAKAPVDEHSPWLFHKTTRREVYDRAMAGWPGVNDVILWNGQGEVTEGCRSNVVLDIGDGLVTPPIGCGLLAGTFRAQLLARGQVREQVVRVADLAAARRVFLVNSVRGFRRAQIVGERAP